LKQVFDDAAMIDRNQADWETGCLLGPFLYSLWSHSASDGKAYKKFSLWKDRESSVFFKSKDEVLEITEQPVDDAGISCTGQVEHSYPLQVALNESPHC
jgi:hypothetical protein